MTGGVTQLCGVVRRDIGRHAHRDAGGTIREQVREGRRQDQRLLVLAVIGLAKIDRAFVIILQDEDRGFGQTRFGVSHGRGAIAVHIAEIALTFDQRIARGEILRQTHQRLIHRLIAMGMEPADNVADHAGAFLEGGVGRQLEKPHGVEKTAVNRLQTVARIGQGPLGDGGERIGEIARGERVIEALIEDTAAIAGKLLAHPDPLRSSK